MKRAVVRFGVGLALFLTMLAIQASAQKPTQLEGAGWAASSKLGPALATDGNNAYIAWVDSATSDIFFSKYASGGWDPPQPVGGLTSSGSTWTAESSATPSWSYDGLAFYILWKAKSSNDIWFSSYSDGAWSPQEVVNGTDPNWTAETSTGPAGVFVGYPAGMLWKGASGNKVWSSDFNFLSPGWTTQEASSTITTNVSPCVEAAPNNIETIIPVFVKSASSNDIYVWAGSKSYEVAGKGASWVAETTVAPAAAVDLNGKDIVFWKGQSGNGIWYSSNTSTTPLGMGGTPAWSTQAQVSGPATNAAPTVAEANGPSIAVALLAWKKATDDTVWYMDVAGLP